jgi:hypothetical protein
MRNVVRFALGLSIIAVSLGMARPASARFGRWVNFVNKDRLPQNGGPFFMGVSGGCNPNTNPCQVSNGAQIIVWANGTSGGNHSDQSWTTPDSGIAFVTNLDPTNTPQQGVLSIQGPSSSFTNVGRAVIIRDAVPGQPSPDQNWEIVPAASYGASTFAGCFVFRNANSSMVASVSGGNVFSGASVIQYPLFVGTPGSSVGWHPDQFWCPM